MVPPIPRGCVRRNTKLPREQTTNPRVHRPLRPALESFKSLELELAPLPWVLLHIRLRVEPRIELTKRLHRLLHAVELPLELRLSCAPDVTFVQKPRSLDGFVSLYGWYGTLEAAANGGPPSAGRRLAVAQVGGVERTADDFDLRVRNVFFSEATCVTNRLLYSS